MKTVTLYSGSGVSLSPVNDIGRVVAKYVRLIAEDGMAITNGKIVTECADVLVASVPDWTDCEPIDTEEATEADYLVALDRLGVSE